jgi:hypothetical protein
MRKSRLMAGASIGALAASALAVAAAIAPAAQAGSASSSTCGSSAGKCFKVSVAPTSIAAGASASFAFTITNEASTQQLGSAKISAPAGLVITGAAGSAAVTSSSALFLNLSLAPSAWTTVTVTATATCGGGGSYTWGLEVKQSNDFSGPPGNDFQIDPASAGNLSGTVTGTCSLAFSAQPGGAAAGNVIGSGFNSSGGPVQVEILDGTGHLATAATAPVSVAIGSNPGPGSLSGTTTVNANAGVAPFSDLSINAPGIGYTLTATSPGIAATTSTDFTIYGSIGGCSTSCSGSSSSKTTTGSATTSSGTAGDLLGVGLGGVSYTCNSAYQPISDPFNVDLLSAAGAAKQAQFSATLEISKSAVQASGHTGASTWQICYADTSPFTTQPGTLGTAVIGGVTYYTGLLPDCSSTQPAPCVQSRNKDNAGDVVITFLAAGDLVFRG